VMHDLGRRIAELPDETAVEVFLRRAPTPEEQERIGRELVELGRREPTGSRPAGLVPFAREPRPPWRHSTG
jgi:hypothetical protein